MPDDPPTGRMMRSCKQEPATFLHVVLLAVFLGSLACGGPEEPDLTPPSRGETYQSSFRACRSNLRRTGLSEMRDDLKARSSDPQDVAKAFARDFARHQKAAFEGCLDALKNPK